MIFPDYIPASVRDHFIQYSDVLLQGLPEIEAEIEEIGVKLSMSGNAPNSENTRLRFRLRQLEQWRSYQLETIECMGRLVGRMEMQDAYSALQASGASDVQTMQFIRVAWGLATIDFSRLRQDMSQAREVSREISDAAKSLADLLAKAEASSTYLPASFFAIEELLAATGEYRGHAADWAWPTMRYVLLGRQRPTGNREPKAGVLFRGVKFSGLHSDALDPVDSRPRHQDALWNGPLFHMDQVRMAWGTAPSVRSLLMGLHEAGRDHEPRVPREHSAALGSRKNSRKMQFLRSFVQELIDWGVDVNDAMKRAIELTASVALGDDPNMVSRADVERAIAGLPVAAHRRAP